MSITTTYQPMEIDAGDTSIYTPSYLDKDYYKKVFSSCISHNSLSHFSTMSNSSSVSQSSFTTYLTNQSNCSSHNFSVPSTFYLNSISSQETNDTNTSYSLDSYSSTSSLDTTYT